MINKALRAQIFKDSKFCSCCRKQFGLLEVKVMLFNPLKVICEGCDD